MYRVRRRVAARIGFVIIRFVAASRGWWADCAITACIANEFTGRVGNASLSFSVSAAGFARPPGLSRRSVARNTEWGH